MNAGSPNGPPPALPRAPAPDFAGSPRPAAVALDHFRGIAAMLELIDRLPDLAEDIRNWRPQRPGEALRNGTAPILEPVARHALDAVLTGLNMLGLAAATLCENAQGRLAPDEIVVCRDIGVAMTSLFERATALAGTADAAGFAAERAELYRSFLRGDPLNPVFTG
jgi:hypothetical protein